MIYQSCATHDRVLCLGPASLGVTSEVRADPQLISVVSVSTTEPLFTASIIIYSESASGHDASTDSTPEADVRISALKDLLSQQQGNEEGTQNYLIDHIITGNEKEASNELEFDISPEFTSSDDVNEEIKVEDLSKLVKNVGIKTMTLDSLEDDHPFIVITDEDEESHTIKLKKEKAAAEAEAAFLSAQPSYPNVQQLTELMVNSLKPELLKLLTDHNFSAFIPTELKEVSSKISNINRAVGGLKKYVEELKFEIAYELKVLPEKLEEFQSFISVLTSKLSKLKVLDALPSLLNKVTEALNRFAHAIESTLQKAYDTSVPSTGQAGTQPAEGENPLNITAQPEGEQVKDKDKKSFSHEEVDEEESESESDAEKKIKQTVKADVAKAEIQKGKEELIDLLGLDVVERMYKYTVKYDKYCLKMLNQRAPGKITNCDVLSRGKGPITLKVYRDDGSDEIIQNFKASDLHLGNGGEKRLDNLHKTEEELELDFSKPLGEHDLISKLNTLAKKKRKNADDLHDYFRSTKSQRQDFISIKYFEEMNNEMLYNVQEIFFRLYKGPGMNNLARTFSTFLVIKVEKRNLNPMKQMRLIEQLKE
ncbi:hypothetical protein Tco_1546999 [Tanacetum coccineum]